MKKLIISILAAALLFTACSGHKNYTADQVKEIVEPYMYKLSIGLSTEWCGDEDDMLLETVGGNIFKALLESTYRTDNGREIYNEDYMVKLEDYADVATEHFPYDKEFITEHFKADRTYDAETDMIACSDGLGSVVSMEISSVEQNGDVYKVNYDAYGPDNAFFDDYGYLTVKINKNGKPVFWGNSRNYTEKDIENMFLHYVPVAMIDYSWDSNFSRESLDNNMFLLSAALEGLYYDTYHEYMYEKNKGLYDSDFRIKVSDLVKMAERHFTFDSKFVREVFESWDSYDADSDTIIEPDGFGLASNIHNIKARKDGDVFKVTYDHSYFDEQPTKDFGTMTVQVSPSGHMVFLSNTVNENATEQLHNTEFKLKESYPTEVLSYSAKVIAERVVNSMSTDSVPESPEFHKMFFLFTMAYSEYQNENFIYNNAFPYTETGLATVFDFDTCEKVIYQVYGDSSWQAKDNFSEDSIQGDKAVQSTDIGWGVLFYGLKEDRQVIFSDDGTQITVRAEMVGPGDTTLDPEIISWGVYDVVLDIVKENGEQFLRFNRFALVEDEQNS